MAGAGKQSIVEALQSQSVIKPVLLKVLMSMRDGSLETSLPFPFDCKSNDTSICFYQYLPLLRPEGVPLHTQRTLHLSEVQKEED